MKKGKLKPPAKPESLIWRAANASNNQRAVVATEAPIPRYVESMDEWVPEILLMSGCTFRGGKNQLPIVDSHDDTTVRNIFGSIRDLIIDQAAGELVGRLVFASDPESQTISQRVADGHITDISVTALPLETIFVKRGEIYTTDRGQVIEGPAIIRTKWEPHNASICATGADFNSVVKRNYQFQIPELQEVKRMLPESVIQSLQQMGLPADIIDPDQVIIWLLGRIGQSSSPEPMDSMVQSSIQHSTSETMEMLNKNPMQNGQQQQPVDNEMVARQAAIAEAVKADRIRRQNIRSQCKLFPQIDEEFINSLCESDCTIEDANNRIIRKVSELQAIKGDVEGDPVVRVVKGAEEKAEAAILEGLTMRSFQTTRIKQTVKPVSGGEDFNRLPLVRMASFYLESFGIDCRRMTDRDIALLAFKDSHTIRKHKIYRNAYHTIGSFTNILLDSAYKTLLAAYDEAPYTWSIWARKAENAKNFNLITQTRLSESPDLAAVPENESYTESVFSDSKERYSVVKYGKIFSVSFEAIVNDDLNAIARIPAMHGAAARRIQNKKVYQVLTDNETMSDGYSLFSSSHASGDNTSGAAAAPSVTTLNAAFVKMMKQTGLTSDSIINVQPRYLIVPANYGATALQLRASLADPAAGGSAAGNSNTINIYGPNGDRPITVVVEPLLDANSSTTWYMAADPMQIDTVEISFLEGEEAPVLDEEAGFDTDTRRWKIRQTFGTKAIDWRGLYRNA